MELIRSDADAHSKGIVTKRGHQVSPEAVQDIFLQFTAPKTSLSKAYSKLLEIKFEEIEHLNSMLEQVLAREHLIGVSVSVIVVHKDKSKQVFDSFNNFKNYASGTSSPTRVVILTYKYAICTAEKKIQNYVLKIELRNKLTAYKELDEEQLPSPMKSLFIRVMPVVELKVEYEDYLKAKILVDTIDEWIDGCPHNDDKLTLFLKKIQNISSVLPGLFSCISVLLIVKYLTVNIEELLNNSSNMQDIFILSAQVLALTFIIIKISRAVGSLVENFLDFYPFLSFVQINKGDSNVIRERNKSILKVIVNIFITIILGAIGSYLMAVICGFFQSLLPK